MKKIGLFGGTFDPLHFGHLNLALGILEARGLDQVLFCPTYRSPFRENLPTASPHQRAEMTQLGIQDIHAFQFCMFELERQGISYTIDTLRALKEFYGSGIELYLLLSSESLLDFHRWKESEAIVQYARPLIGTRNTSSKEEIPPSPVKEALIQGMTVTTRMEVSSTQIRNRLKKRLYCGYLVPAKVLDYIQKHHLYL